LGDYKPGEGGGTSRHSPKNILVLQEEKHSKAVRTINANGKKKPSSLLKGPHGRLPSKERTARKRRGKNFVRKASLTKDFED